MSIYHTYLSAKQYLQENKFYVYAYLRSKDSNNGTIGSPYYIGKGQGNRAYTTCRRIKKPKDKNNILIISDNINEADSFQLEMLLINIFGRIDLKTGCLHNLSDGGEGPAGNVRTEEYKDNLRKLKTGKKRPKFSKEWLENIAIAQKKRGWKPMEGKKHLQESLEKMKKNSQNRIHIYHPDLKIRKFIKPTLLNLYLKEGYILGRLKTPGKKIKNWQQTQEQKDKCSERTKDRIHVCNKDLNIQKFVKNIDVDNYLKNGYELGRLPFKKIRERNKL